MKLNFIKMNGSGNDFVVIDARKEMVSLSRRQVRMLCARDNIATKGSDQLVVLEKSDKADVFMRIYNADGGEVDACGNVTRCIADMLYLEFNRLPVTIATNAGILSGSAKEEIDGIKQILVDMGKPRFSWRDIPLAMPEVEAAEKIKNFINLPELGEPNFVSMGNPHVVFFMSNLIGNERAKLVGEKIENFTEVFPKRVNVSFSKIFYDKDGNAEIQAKVWERGAGLTAACGTGACAMLAAANKINTSIDFSKILFKNSGQSVYASIRKDGNMMLGGAVETEFNGIVEI
ncbi:MAG: diaminopimelate epimerase [Rickettsiales bacterium]